MWKRGCRHRPSAAASADFLARGGLGLLLSLYPDLPNPLMKEYALNHIRGPTMI